MRYTNERMTVYDLQFWWKSNVPQMSHVDNLFHVENNSREVNTS